MDVLTHGSPGQALRGRSRNEHVCLACPEAVHGALRCVAGCRDGTHGVNRRQLLAGHGSLLWQAVSWGLPAAGGPRGDTQKQGQRTRSTRGARARPLQGGGRGLESQVPAELVRSPHSAPHPWPSLPAVPPQALPLLSTNGSRFPSLEPWLGSYLLRPQNANLHLSTAGAVCVSLGSSFLLQAGATQRRDRGTEELWSQVPAEPPAVSRAGRGQWRPPPSRRHLAEPERENGC